MGPKPESLDWSSAQARWAEDARGRETRLHEHQRLATAIALRMDELTQSDPWNAYAAHVKGLLDRAEQTLAECERRMLDGDEVGEALIRLKFAAKEAKGEIRAYRACLALPEHLQTLAAWRPENRKKRTDDQGDQNST